MDEVERQEKTESELYSGWLDEEKTMKKEIVSPGEGLKCPRDSSRCRILLRRRRSFGSCVDSAQMPDLSLDVLSDIVLGECDSAVGRGIEKILLTMKVKEESDIVLRIRTVELYEFDSDEKKKEMEKRKQDLSTLNFRLKLDEFEAKPEIYEVDDASKICRAKRHKQCGVELFQKGFIYSAFYRFSKAVKLLMLTMSRPLDDDSEMRSECEELTIACRLNMAACQLRTGRYELVVQNCDRVLTSHKENAKALYRRGVANMNLQDYEKARKDFITLLDLQPDNQDAKNQLEILVNREKNLDLFFAHRMSRLFK